MLDSNDILKDNLLNEGLSNVEKYDMEPKTINYTDNKDDKILSIVSVKLFGTENNVKAEYTNRFNANELSALNTSAQNIQETFSKEIKDDNDVQKAFIEIRLNYIKILKILNRKVKKFEVREQDKNNLSDFEKAVIDQFEKIKRAIIFFEHAEWGWTSDFNKGNQTLYNLIENQKIELKLLQLNVDFEKLKGACGCLGSVHIKSESKIKAREIVEIKIESSLS